MNAIERERILQCGDTLEQRKEAFKEDPDLMGETSRFVNEVFVSAENEVAARKQALREDEELVRETSKFVSEVIECAAAEALKRKAATERGQCRETNREGQKLKMSGSIAEWNNRARDLCARVLNALCPCFTDNALFAWTPYRYHFSRP